MHFIKWIVFVLKISFFLVCFSDNEKKMFSVSLADQKGQWIGKRSGKNYKLRKSISELVLEGDTKIKIIHQAREDKLQSVISIAMGLAKKSI